MLNRCDQILNALKAENTLLDGDLILSHMEECADCRKALELPTDISTEIGNINLIPAPEKIYENVMTILRSKQSARKGLYHLKLVRAGAISTLYLAISFVVAFNWNTLIVYLHAAVGNIISLFKLNASQVSIPLDVFSNIAEILAQSPLFNMAILMSMTIIWALTLVKIRDTLKS